MMSRSCVKSKDDALDEPLLLRCGLLLDVCANVNRRDGRAKKNHEKISKTVSRNKNMTRNFIITETLSVYHYTVSAKIEIRIHEIHDFLSEPPLLHLARNH